MFRRLRLSLPLMVIALSLGSATPAEAIIINYRTLTDDIRGLAPPVLQSSLLAKVDAAMAATDRGDFCPAVKTLVALVNELEANGNAGIGDPNQIGDPTIRTLEADVADVLGSFPPDPCAPPSQT
jgi:hypothetical protein